MYSEIKNQHKSERERERVRERERERERERGGREEGERVYGLSFCILSRELEDTKHLLSMTESHFHGNQVYHKQDIK